MIKPGNSEDAGHIQCEVHMGEVAWKSGELEDFFLREYGGGEITYIPNFGNAGDALISLGAFAFFDRLGIKWHLRRDWWNLKNTEVVFAGGGALIGCYKRSDEAVAMLLANDNRVVILPHTITKLSQNIVQNSSRLVVFAREKKTYHYLKELGCLPFVGIDHDMAFNLIGSLDDLLARSFIPLVFAGLTEGGPRDRLRIIKRLIPAISGRMKTRHLEAQQRSESLKCFRVDIESSGRQLPNGNVDVSDIFALGTETRASIELSAYGLLSCLSEVPRIETDRLHCCIGGVLLGKRVGFYGNSYHKNRSVFDYSIKDRFPNACWRED